MVQYNFIALLMVCGLQMRQQIILQRNFQHIGPQMMEDALAVGCALNARNSVCTKDTINVRKFSLLSIFPNFHSVERSSTLPHSILFQVFCED